jgi:hypothetical protein
VFHTFSSTYTIAGVLLQKNDQGDEQPIYFMSKNLRDLELNYTIMEKQAYALVKSLKTLSNLCRIKDCLGSRGKWFSKIQEYDLEIKPTKIIKGKGMTKMMTERNQVVIEVGEKEQVQIIISEIENNERYSYVIY